MAELKPCPFCGEKPKLRRSLEEFDNGAFDYVCFVRCENTACELNPCTTDYGEAHLAIDAWNRRS